MTRIVPVATVAPLVLNAIGFDAETAGSTPSTALTDETEAIPPGTRENRVAPSQDQAEAGSRGGESGS